LPHLGTDFKLFSAFSGGIPAVNEIFLYLTFILYLISRRRRVLRDHGGKFYFSLHLFDLPPPPPGFAGFAGDECELGLGDRV